MKMQQDEMVRFVYALDEEDLFTINKMIVERIRNQRKIRNIAAIGSLCVGMRIRYIGTDGKIPKGTEGVVTKLGRTITHAIMEMPHGRQNWRISPTLLEPAKKIDGDSLVDAISNG